MVRQYKKEYLQFGIVPIGHQPKCLFCKWMGSNESMKPNLLQRHFKNHPEYHNKPLDFFQRKKEEYEAEKRQAKKCYFTPKSSLKASFVAAEFIAKAKKPYSIGQELVLPCTKAIVKEMLGEQAAAKVGTVALSANTVRRRVMDLGEDIENQLKDGVLASPMFAIQIDESTDVSNKAILLVFVRYRGDESMVEDMLTCEELTGNTTAQEIFTKIDEYITGKGLVWANCVGVCTDGAAAMTGRHNGVVQLIKRVAPEAAATHCFLHRENLAAKDLSNELANVMDISVKVINLLRKNALNSRLFANLCNENEAEHTMLLYFAAVRWLSRGRALERVFDLREEVHTFLQEKNSDLAEHFVDEEFLSTLAYMADIFGILNDLNTSFQGHDKTIFSMLDKVAAFKMKLEMWIRRVREGDIGMFIKLHQFVAEGEGTADVNAEVIIRHLSNLRQRFEKYFPPGDDIRREYDWVRDPYNVDVRAVDLNPTNREKLIDLVNDGMLRNYFQRNGAVKFWIHVKGEYGELSDMALKVLLPFTTTYMCESAFSAVAYLKNKHRNRLQTDALRANLRVALSPHRARIDEIVRRAQAHPSH